MSTLSFPLGQHIGKKKAHAKAQAILDLYSHEYGSEVDIEKIVAELKISVIQHDLPDDESGMLIINKERKAIIVVNKHHSKVRKRFTIAHELGHYLMHCDQGQQVFHRSIKSSQGTEPQEIDANAFAAALLMPKADIKKLIREINNSLFDDEVDDLIVGKANELNVSKTALIYRIQGF